MHVRNNIQGKQDDLPVKEYVNKIQELYKNN